MAVNTSVLKAQDFLKSDQGKLVLMLVLILLLAASAFFITMRLTTPKATRVISKPVDKPVEIPPTTKPPTATEEEKKSDTFEIYQSKDPFEPLIVQQPAVPAQPGVTTPGDITTPAVPVSNKNQITLLEVFTEDNIKYASVQVGSTVYKVKEGEAFASNYKLVSIGSDTVTILYGDDSATLKIGETIYK